MRARRVAQPGVKEHKAVKVGVKGVEGLRPVQGVVVLHVRRHLQLVRDAVLDDGAKRVARRPLRQGELRVPVEHRFRPDEHDVRGRELVEEKGELLPDLARQGGLGPRAENEDADGWRGGADVGDTGSLATQGLVEGVAESW